MIILNTCTYKIRPENFSTIQYMKKLPAMKGKTDAGNCLKNTLKVGRFLYFDCKLIGFSKCKIKVSVLEFCLDVSLSVHFLIFSFQV